MSLCHQVHFVARRISFGFSFGLCSMSNATNQVIRNQPRRILHLLLLHRSEFASYQRQWNCLTACFQKHLHLSLNNSCILKKKDERYQQQEAQDIKNVRPLPCSKAFSTAIRCFTTQSVTTTPFHPL
jgi:hypothetical protein